MSRFVKIWLWTTASELVILAVWVLWSTTWWARIYSLGGIGTAAAAYKLIPRARKERLEALLAWQMHAPSKMLKSALITADAILLLSLLSTFAFATLIIRSEQTEDLGVQVSTYKPLRKHFLKANEEYHTLVLASWLQSRPVNVIADGLPVQFVKARPWSRTVLAAPTDFLKTIRVLVVPDDALVGDRYNDYDVKVQVRRSNRQIFQGTSAFDGKAFWIGCTGSASVPDQDKFDLPPQEIGLSDHGSWQRSCKMEVQLSGGDEVDVEIHSHSGRVRHSHKQLPASTPVTVARLDPKEQ